MKVTQNSLNEIWPVYLFTFCRVFDRLSFDPRSFYPMLFDPMAFDSSSFDPMSMNRLNESKDGPVQLNVVFGGIDLHELCVWFYPILIVFLSSGFRLSEVWNKLELLILSLQVFFQLFFDRVTSSNFGMPKYFSIKICFKTYEILTHPKTINNIYTNIGSYAT